MKRKATIAAVLALLLCLAPFAGGAFKQEVIAQGEIGVTVQGKPLKLATPAYIKSGSTLIPLREIAEALGATVTYNETDGGLKTVTLERNGRTALLTIGSATMTANGKTVKLPLAPRVENSITMVPLRALSEALGTVVAWDGAERIVTIDEPKQLPKVGTAKKLMELIQAAVKYQNKGIIHLTGQAETATAASDGGSAPSLNEGGAVVVDQSGGRGESEADAGDDHSATNVQVEGVDEADWAKTDGDFVYQISGNRVIITDISNPAQPKLAAVMEYTEKDGFYPQELYVDDRQLLVIGQQNLYEPAPPVTHNPGAEGAPVDSGGVAERPTVDGASGSGDDGIASSGSAGATSPGSSGAGATSASPGSAPSSGSGGGSQPNPGVETAPDPGIDPDILIDPIPDDKFISIYPPMYSRSTVKTFVYQLSESGKPELTRELSQEGSYVSSRKIGDALYVVTNKYNNIYPMYDTLTSKKSSAKDEAMAREEIAAAVEPVYGDSAVSDKLQTLSLDEVRYFPNPTDNSMMLVGAVDLSQPNQALQMSAYLGSGSTVYASEKHLYVAIGKYEMNGDEYKQQTVFHKFRLDQGQVVYIGEGSVPGNLLNQFSMDEHEGYFRVALTNGDMWASGAQGSTNNVYVLDEKLSVAGKLEGLAPGERIYSVRFMGDRAYMVTFRNVDPLFVIDLSHPANPSVLGQLKIPGYSDYLHPYDENHIIGFGKETVEVPSKGMGPDETMAFYQGMKIAMFDVTDVTQPKELFKEVIGDRGTGSELLYNHKALLFSKAKGLMAFPVELYEIKNKDSLKPGEFPAYGEFVYQGAYVYGIDLQNGFQLKGRISHLSEDDLKKSGQYGYDYNKTVRRILYSGDTLYTLSDSMLKANGLTDLNERGTLVYPPLPQPQWGGKGEIDMMPLPAVIE
ncbi:beta-propeller domain-containing protein [Paenibacillus sp. LHD-117]|uniref:beta-propeller domain-containing protein n=1 Tax=Paenibacillus sp. LHD-117 TaxID=3071412 RepID=UPI0027E036C9|nr:beta-propeller domain-containing protein [Paenibacillus sp. LHD-117]MDQ6420057.1 beta-propeller domain-containing protein [Paenibacillus sp. LHD-117]